MKPSMKSPCLLPRFTNQTSIKGTPYHRHLSSQHFSTETAHSHVCLPTLDCEPLIFSPQAYGLAHTRYMHFLIRGLELKLVLVGQEETWVK